MLKVLVAALIGTAAGVAVMVIVIVASGTTTSNASSIGLGSLPITTASPSSASSSTPSSGSGGSTGGSTGGSGGNAAAGKTIFTGSAGCSGCHTFTPAGATGTVGPNLDDISADQKASGEPLDQFISDSITDPDKYIAKGFSPGIMPPDFGTSLSKADIADLVAFISQNQTSS
jgi:cytochrome c551/c552